MTRDKNIQRRLDQIRKDLEREWGNAGNLSKLGARLHRALLAEAILQTIYIQDEEEVSDESVRALAVAGWEWVREVTDY